MLIWNGLILSLMGYLTFYFGVGWLTKVEHTVAACKE